jgi:acetate kinase
MKTGVLTINGGSSSIKFALYAPGDPPRPMLSGKVERIGLGDGLLTAKGEGSQPPVRQALDASDYGHAVEALIAWLDERVKLRELSAVGHRIVHGGKLYNEARAITPEMVVELQRLILLDPDHMPEELALIDAFARRFPDLPQVACFDTAFHRDLPRVARLLPLPRHFEAAGVRRYGFHGLSYAFLMEELERVAGPEAARGRVILAHLGSGASMAAVQDGKCMDTSMAFTPTAGLVMATRTGDLDPGVLLYLMRSERMDARQIDDLVNRRSGLLGVSETSPDMRDLLDRQAADPRAADAVALFCYQAKKWLGAFAAALGGLDTLVFAGGIGENAVEVRARICDGLGHIGLALDNAGNAANAAVISAATSRVVVRVIRTDEESQIAKTVFRLLGDRPA